MYVGTGVFIKQARSNPGSDYVESVYGDIKETDPRYFTDSKRRTVVGQVSCSGARPTRVGVSVVVVTLRLFNARLTKIRGLTAYLRENQNPVA